MRSVYAVCTVSCPKKPSPTPKTPTRPCPGSPPGPAGQAPSPPSPTRPGRYGTPAAGPAHNKPSGPSPTSTAGPGDEHQTHQLWIAYEKRTLTAQVRDWFADYGPRFVALAGYESETLDRQTTNKVHQDGRPAVVVYAGDLDPSGEDTWRSFLKHTGGLWDQAQRVAVTWEQVETHQLPVLPGKTTDSRAKAFTATHGRLAQIEVEAHDPNTPHNIYTHTTNPYIDRPTWNQVIETEQADRQALTRLADGPL